MIGQNISFIVGQHHSELDQAIWHHRGRNGFVLDVAAIHESVGQEVIAMWFDRTSFLETLSGCETIDLRVRCGLAVTQAGPIAFVLWWLPPVDEEGVPYFLKEHVLNPMHEGNRQVLRRLGGQKCLHVALVGSGPRLLGLHEFKHDYGFSDLYSYAQAAAEKGWPGYNFDVVHSAFEEAFNVGDLLHGRYPELTLLAGDAPDS
jgi:hypothetical protein